MDMDASPIRTKSMRAVPNDRQNDLKNSANATYKQREPTTTSVSLPQTKSKSIIGGSSTSSIAASKYISSSDQPRAKVIDARVNRSTTRPSSKRGLYGSCSSLQDTFERSTTSNIFSRSEQPISNDKDAMDTHTRSHSVVVELSSDEEKGMDDVVHNTKAMNLAETSYNPNESSSIISVCKGDLTTQSTDVIVVCASSEFLFNYICKAGGDSMSDAYKVELNKDVNAPVVALNASGTIAAKRIFFLQWKNNADATILKTSIEKFVSDAIQKAVAEGCHSIAFPAIGCGKFGCSLDLVAQAMVGEANRNTVANSMSISFVIQPDRKDIYDAFEKQINLKQTQASSNKLKAISEIVGIGKIEVEQGDITKKKVDVIVGSSSSEFLRKAIINAAGESVQTVYDAELMNHPNSILIVTPPGRLCCKQIFFVKWIPDKDEDELQRSLRDMISTVVQNAMSYKFTSIAFPAIGCGLYGCSVDVVVKTMVLEMKRHLIERKLPWTVKFVIQPSQLNVYDEFCKQLLTTQDGLQVSHKYQLPSIWGKSTPLNIRFTLPSTTDEYKSIVTNFHQAMTGNYTQIIRIERIQNERWYMQYIAHYEDFKRRLNLDTEKRLYHGCPEIAANSIIDECFNRSFAGVNGIVYGVGVYFSSNAVYSHGYATANATGERCMFVARVLIGKTTLGNQSMKTRPLGFDSTTDNNHIFVTYHDAQAFAEHLITYK